MQPNIIAEDLIYSISEYVKKKLKLQEKKSLWGKKYISVDTDNPYLIGTEEYIRLKEYFSALLDIYYLFEKGGICLIFTTIDDSLVEFEFYIPASQMAHYNGRTQKELLEICLFLTTGYQHHKRSGAFCSALSPRYSISKVDNLKENFDLLNDLENILDNELYKNFQTLPTDIKKRGNEMTEVYLYLYCIENTLRLFIEKVCVNIHGQNYFSKLSIPSKISTDIHNRKTNEARHKWLSERGNSDLYYLDFKDLSDIITNNWSLFDKYIPHQNWIKAKIDELASIRNLVAHNSYIGEHEKDVLKLNFHTLLKQINS